MFVALATLALVACGEKTRYQTQLLLKNELDVPIEVALYPKSAAYAGPGVYKSSPKGGSFFSREFTLNSDHDNVIFYDTKFGIRPAGFAASVFDSIVVFDWQDYLEV